MQLRIKIDIQKLHDCVKEKKKKTSNVLQCSPLKVISKFVTRFSVEHVGRQRFDRIAQRISVRAKLVVAVI